MTKFTELGLAEPLLAALETEGYQVPTPIQAQAIPPVLQGRDLVGIAQTGTGKTAAFALPILHRLLADKRPPQAGSCRALVLAPTRELASQIADSFLAYGKKTRLTAAVVFGGVDFRRQLRAMSRGVDVLVATPGRLVDHIQQGTIRLDGVEVVVLDEVDRMLDIGFIHTVRRLMALTPKTRQCLFFSATMPKEIAALAAELLKDPARVSVAPVASTAERVDQQLIYVEQPQKRAVLAGILATPEVGRALVFTRTKHRADQVVRYLEACGIAAAAIHGNKSQNQRERALGGFRHGQVRVLVATDIAARGIDVEGITHVFNFDLPDVPETYVHRIGRTARAGAEGIAIAFCASDERLNLRDIERLIKKRIFVVDPNQVPSLAPSAEAARVLAAAPRPEVRSNERGRAPRPAAAPVRQPGRPQAEQRPRAHGGPSRRRAG